MSGRPVPHGVPTYQVLGLPRNPIGVALKDVLTFGIYGKFWLVRINRELDGHERFRLNFVALWILVLLPLVTPLYAKWKTLHRLDRALRHQITVSPPNPKLLWLISLLPILGTITWVAWTQSLLNRHWLWHKRDERIVAKTERIAELGAKASDPKVRTRIATLQGEVRELETQREKELGAAEARRRVREEKRAARPKRRLIPVRLGRKPKAQTTAGDEEPAAERPKRRIPFLGRTKAKQEEASQSVPPLDAIAAPAAEGPEEPEEKPRKLGLFRRKKETTPAPEATPEAAAPAPSEPDLESMSPRQRKKFEKRQAKDDAKREKEEAKAAKQAEKDAKKAEKAETKAAKKRERKGEPESAPAAPRAPSSTPAQPIAQTVSAQTQATSSGQVVKTVKVLTLRCPQCQTRIEGIRKVAGEAARVECPSCHFTADV